MTLESVGPAAFRIHPGPWWTRRRASSLDDLPLEDEPSVVGEARAIESRGRYLTEVSVR